MKRPEWVPTPAWSRLEAALRGHPAHAEEALTELGALTEHWDEEARLRLIDAFEKRARCGLLPIAAMTYAVWDLLDGDDAIR